MPPEASSVTGQETKKKKKRQRIVDFFRSRKKRGSGEVKEHPKITPPPLKPVKESHSSEPTLPVQSIDVARSSGELFEPQQPPAQLPSPPPEPKPKDDRLDEQQIQALFLGAPHFTLTRQYDRPEPLVTFPWDRDTSGKNISDAVPLSHYAFSAATLRPHVPAVQGNVAENEKSVIEYDAGVFEVPTVLGAQGIEPGSVGFNHFLQLPASDSLATDLQQSQSSNDFLEAVRNKEIMHSNPERLGIRPVTMDMVHERLAEFGDILDALRDSPKRMTILNNQSVGDLYANLFGKFLLPPGYDSTTTDPTGLKVQIDTLLKILKLTGIWYDFSLVEWRIRLGQILWGEPSALSEYTGAAMPESRLWTVRDVLLLQILLSCELLLRLDAISAMDQQDIQEKMGVSLEEFAGLALKNRKVRWDFVLARRFLENIIVVVHTEKNSSVPPSGLKGLLSMLSREDEEEPSSKSDIVLLPRHQLQQLLGLIHFAEAVKWPDTASVVTELGAKLGMTNKDSSDEDRPSVYGTFLEPATPSISVYGTPLPTPRSGESVRSSYFGNVARPALSRRDTPRSLKVPLSTSLLSQELDGASKPLNIGGWLSRSYLSGLILPGEAISHFLISTLLENDKMAIGALGDSANLYGGFVYNERSWWSKNSITGRVLACLEGAVECMGWISIPDYPEGCADGWYVVDSEQVQSLTGRINAEINIVSRDSAILPEDLTGGIEPHDLTLALDSITPPVPSLEFTGWTLIPTAPHNPDDHSSNMSSEVESCRATLMFNSIAHSTAYTLTLSNDVYFVSSFPCTPPTATQAPKLLSLAQSLSRSSSKRSVRSNRSNRSNRPVRRPSRRNSHGYEPLLSHPPDSPGLGPTRVYSPIPDEEAEGSDKVSATKPDQAPAHPLHVSYKYKVVQVTEVLDPHFVRSLRHSTDGEGDNMAENLNEDNKKEILVLDARGKRDLELLARAWCSERGLHAIIGREWRTCLSCCIREARGLGVGVVIRI
jgi:hypothetical protein